MTARVGRALRRDEGVTLTELIVVMFVLSIVVAATATLTIGFTRTNQENVARQDQVDVARAAVERISRNVRTAVKPSQLVATCAGCDADAFMEAKDTSVRFYANIDNPGNSVGPSRVTYVLGTTGTGAGVLTEYVQVPDSATPTATGYAYCDALAVSASSACKARLKTRRLAEGVQLDAPLFKYYGPDGSRMTAGTAGLSGANLEKVIGIELVLRVRSTEATSARPTTYIQRITLPNAQAVVRQGEDN